MTAVILAVQVALPLGLLVWMAFLPADSLAGFVLQAAVLFPSASARLGPDARATLREVARAVRDIAAKIPDEIEWVLRVDGHTDERPIRTDAYASNWELSAARAIAVVEVLIAQGVPPERLAAAGFAQFQPIASGDSEEAYRQNRRIEFTLTQP